MSIARSRKCQYAGCDKIIPPEVVSLSPLVKYCLTHSVTNSVKRLPKEKIKKEQAA